MGACCDPAKFLNTIFPTISSPKLARWIAIRKGCEDPNRGREDHPSAAAELLTPVCARYSDTIRGICIYQGCHTSRLVPHFGRGLPQFEGIGRILRHARRFTRWRCHPGKLGSRLTPEVQTDQYLPPSGRRAKPLRPKGFRFRAKFENASSLRQRVPGSEQEYETCKALPFWRRVGRFSYALEMSRLLAQVRNSLKFLEIAVNTNGGKYSPVIETPQDFALPENMPNKYMYETLLSYIYSLTTDFVLLTYYFYY